MAVMGPDINYARYRSADAYKEILGVLAKYGVTTFKPDESSKCPKIFIMMSAKLNDMLDIDLKKFIEELFVEDACANW